MNNKNWPILPDRRIINDCYGISSGLSNYAKTSSTLKYSYLHGWFTSSTPCFLEGYFVEHANKRSMFLGKRRSKLLVNTKRQKECFELLGLNVEAIGLPFFYQEFEAPNLERIKDSILFVPSHGCFGFDQEVFYTQQDEISEMDLYKDNYLISLMVSAFDLKSDKFKTEYPIISGADIGDSNTFLRMKYIFSQFEFACFFSFTSAIIYASLFGCKVFLSKSFRNPRPESVFKVNKKIPLRILIEMDKAIARNRLLCDFDFIGDDISSASFSTELALSELGYDCKKKPEEINHLIIESNEWFKNSNSIFSKIDRFFLKKLLGA